MTGKLFTPLNIFMVFFVVFNFGQCLLWALGIHSNHEIGESRVFSVLAADDHVILQAQLIFIICFITLNCGAVLAWKRKSNIQLEPLRSEKTAHDIRYQYLFYTALILSLVVIPVVLYNAIYTYQLARVYGYSSLYNGEANDLLMGPVVSIVTQMFLPCLLGLLIGSRYNKLVRMFVYGVFLLYAVITLLTGDRGEWLMPFLFLFWADYFLYKKRKGKVLIIALVVGVFALMVVDAITSMRNTGLSLEGFVSALTTAEENIIVSTILEFGHSMGIAILLLANPVKCPYGNTYLMSIITIFGSGIANRVFGTNYVQLHTWFPKYLGIRYGTDFSIIGEAMLNYGVYATPFVLLVEGFIIAKIAQLPYRKNIGPLALCLSLSAMSYVVLIVRSTVWIVLNSAIYSVIIFNVGYFLVKQVFSYRRKFRR